MGQHEGTMKSIDEQLRTAAELGDQAAIRALLRRPECDASAKDNRGMTALMLPQELGAIRASTR